MFDSEALRNTLSSNPLGDKQKILPQTPKRHSTGTIMRRTQVPGVPTAMKLNGGGGAMSSRIRKMYKFENIDIPRILETSLTSNIISDRAMHRRAIERARTAINSRTSLASKMSNTRRSVPSKIQKNQPIYRPVYSPNEPKIEKDVQPKWTSKG